MLSIVVPAYNKPNELIRLVQSLRDCIHPYELVISDDNSTDPDMPSALSEISSTCPKNCKLTIITNKKNVGIANNTNRGIEASSGQYIALMDADDYLLSGHLQYLIPVILNSGADWGFTDRLELRPAARPEHVIFGNQRNLQYMQMTDALLLDMFASHLKFYRKDTLLKAGPFDSLYETCIDYDMALRLAFGKFNCKYIPVASYVHVISDAQTTQQRWIDQVKEANELRRARLGVPQKPFYLTKQHIIKLLDAKSIYSSLYVIISNNKIYKYEQFDDFIDESQHFSSDNSDIILLPSQLLPKHQFIDLYKRFQGRISLYIDPYLDCVSWYQFYSGFFPNIICSSSSVAMIFKLSSPKNTLIYNINTWS